MHHSLVSGKGIGSIVNVGTSYFV